MVLTKNLLLAIITAGLTAACCYAEIPAPDRWTEESLVGWSPGPLSQGRVKIAKNNGQLVGSRATGVWIQPGKGPLTSGGVS